MVHGRSLRRPSRMVQRNLGVSDSHGNRRRYRFAKLIKTNILEQISMSEHILRLFANEASGFHQFSFFEKGKVKWKFLKIENEKWNWNTSRSRGKILQKIFENSRETRLSLVTDTWVGVRDAFQNKILFCSTFLNFSLISWSFLDPVRSHSPALEEIPLCSADSFIDLLW